MPNDSNELKKNEELCEEKKKITQEELERVTGGISTPGIFPLSLRKADSKGLVVIACRSLFGEDDDL